MFANIKRERERLVQAGQSKHCIGGSTSRERERDWCRHIKVNIATADRQVEREREREREIEKVVQAHQIKHCIGGSTNREREMCVCVLFEFRQFVFLLWELVYVFQSFVSIFAKKSDRTTCLALILEYNLGPKY